MMKEKFAQTLNELVSLAVMLLMATALIAAQMGESKSVSASVSVERTAAAQGVID